MYDKLPQDGTHDLTVCSMNNSNIFVCKLCTRGVMTKGHVAATKSHCVHTQGNEAGTYMSLRPLGATCPLVCPKNFKLVQHEFFSTILSLQRVLQVQLVELHGT